jgi:hypothetical protein
MAEKPAEKFQEAREHMKAARTSVRTTFEGLLPKDFVEHQRAARKEILLALRSLLDAAIEKAGGQ